MVIVMRQKYSIDLIRRIAIKRGGECLSEKCEKSKDRIQLRCANGHVWETCAFKVMDGSWCRTCAAKLNGQKKMLEISTIHKIAEERDGVLLSNEYKGNCYPLIWKCKNGHVFTLDLANVKQGKWCRLCAGFEIITVDTLRVLAKARGGLLLSNEYKDTHSNYMWQCSEGHKWLASANNIRRGKWCPDCNASLGERLCRVLFESLFKTGFPTVYPKWLRGDMSGRPHIDGYNDTLRLGFEHQGVQHYKEVKFFEKNKNLRRRIECDNLKRQLCYQNGVTLIEIPAVPDIIPVEELKLFVKEKLYESGFGKIPSDIDMIEIDWNKAYIGVNREYLRKLNDIAIQKGGECLSKEYKNSRTEMQWKCSEGHIWNAPANRIKNGKWCPICFGNKKLSIEIAYSAAEKRGGRCLSVLYENQTKNLLWECSKRHIWQAPMNRIRHGAWCPKCARRQRLTIEEMRDEAKKHGGKCLSEKYISSKYKLEWMCKNGHRWPALPGNIKAGHWCPVCARNQAVSSGKD
jgi:hypothetical protein